MKINWPDLILWDASLVAMVDLNFATIGPVECILVIAVGAGGICIGMMMK